MAEASLKVPHQSPVLSSGQQESVRRGRNRVILSEHPTEYFWYRTDNLPSALAISQQASEQPTDGTTVAPANQEEQPTLENLRERLASSVVKVSQTLPVQDRFILLQKWEGTITTITKDSFFGRLADLSAAGPDEEAEFPLEEVPVSDRKLIVPGAVFYWCIGYLDTVSGQRIRASAIRFRRLPAWSEEELRKAHSQAQETRELLGWK